MYAKVFAQIFDSTLADNWQHRHVFEDLLKLADQRGFVDMTPESIIARTRLPKEMVMDAIEALMRPDPRSRSKDEEGRRIVLIDPQRPWGWRIVNYLHYRGIKTEFDRTGYMRNYMRERRQLDSVKHESNNVKLSPSASASSSESVPVGGRGLEKEDKPEQAVLPISVPIPRFRPPTEEEAKLQGAKIGLPEPEVLRFLAYYGSNGWRVGKNPMKNWVLAMSGWKVRWEQDNGGFKPAPNGKPVSGADIRMAIQLKEERAREIKERYSTEGPVGTDWNNKDKQREFYELKKQIRELKAKAERLVSL